MSRFSKRSCLLLAAAALFFVHGCVTTENKTSYSTQQIFTGTVSDRIKCADSIDRYKTYEIYFRPEKQVSCMVISITGTQLEQGITGSSKPVKVFFIVDRMIDITRYGKTENAFVNTELARNYNRDWEQTREISLCSKENDPIMQINNGSRYRIRFTTFASEKYEYSVSFKTDIKINYWEP